MKFFLRNGFLNSVRIPFIFCFLFFVFGTTTSIAADCETIVKELVGGFTRIQERGGIWALFERSAALKDKSVLGLQLDGKLRRAISVFENYCENEPTKATAPLAKQILVLIDEGRMINNNNPDRVPIKKFVADVQSLLQKTNKFLNSVEK